MDKDLLDSLAKLLALLIAQFGAKGTVILFLVLLLFLASRRLYLDWRADRVTNEALAEKERTIQRLANQEREWRVYFFVQGGMERDEAEAMVLRNEFSTPQDARRHLERRRRRED